MNRFWEQRSRRENALALTALALLVAAVVTVVVGRGVETLRDLNSRVESLEQELLIFHQHLAQSEEVEAAFRQVAAAHSSRLSKAEIHDYLRREIYRLALRNPEAMGDAPRTQGLLGNNYLVRIPVLREGVLNELHEGYREYEIGFRVPSATIGDVLLFLERLQKSDQLLRVDVLDIARSSRQKAVSGSFEVTRAVIDRPEGDVDELGDPGNFIRNASFEDWSDGGRVPSYWTVEGCSVRRTIEAVTHGALAMELTPEAENARIFQLRTLDRGEKYVLSLDISAQSPGLLTILDVDGKPIGTWVNIVPDGRPYRYEVSFEAPWAAGPKALVMAPNVTLAAGAGPVVVDNVRLQKVEE